MAKAVIVSATRTAIGTLGGALAQQPATKLGAIAVREAMRAGEAHARAGRRGHPRQRAPRGPRPEPGARRQRSKPACRRRSPAYGRQQGLRLGPEGGRARRAVGRPRRRRHRRRGRHGEHERRALPPEEGALRLPHGPRPAHRLDDRRRPHLPDHPRPHGHHRRERRGEVRHLAGGAGRVRGREPGEGRRGHQGRQVQGRDRPGRGRRAKKGETFKLRDRRASRGGNHGREARSRCAPAFKQDGGRSPPATRPASTTARAALVVMSDQKAKELGLTPLATIRAYASAGVDPSIMGMGPWPASEKALEKAGLRKEEIDLWELNEAFAAQSLGVLRELSSRRTAST